jgi:GNAT superfamily N-acetyltransferase
MTESAIDIRPLAPDDRNWAHALWTERWGSSRMVSRGVLFSLTDLPALVAWRGDVRAGVATYHIHDDDCELTSLDSVLEGVGVGTALIRAVIDTAKIAGCARLWLVTTNDNTHALRYYQRLGFRLAALHPGAVEAARRLKPEIPLLGLDEIPIRDELELEIRW